MRRPVFLIVAIGSLVAATLWLVMKRRHPAIERTSLAYVPEERAVRERSSAPVAVERAAEEPKAPRQPTERERALGPPRWQPRPKGDWQGMLVNLNVQPPCDGPALCGMALACKNGRCGPCEFDAECGPGESCVLDHCLRSANVSCHHTADCQPRSTCILSGYSGGARGNAEMRAYCLALESGASRSSPPPEGPPPRDPRQNLPNDDLLGAADKARQP